MARSYSNSGRGLMGISIVIILVVLALGIFAVVKSSTARNQKSKLESYNATIAERADAMGYEVNDFLAAYGLSDSGFTGKENESEAYNAMTLSNYVKFYNGTAPTEAEFEAFKAANADVAKDATLDSTDGTVKYAYMTYLQEQQEAAQAAQSQSKEMDGGVNTGAGSDAGNASAASTEAASENK